MKLYPHHIHTDMQYLNRWDKCAGPIPCSASKRKRALGFDTVYLHDLWHWWDLVNPWKASMGIAHHIFLLVSWTLKRPPWVQPIIAHHIFVFLNPWKASTPIAHHIFVCFLNPWKAYVGRAHHIFFLFFLFFFQFFSSKYFNSSLIPCQKFGSPYLGKAAAAVRAVLPILTRVCSIFMCPHNGMAASV